MIWIWFFICMARGRQPDRFYTYIGFGQYLIPLSAIDDESNKGGSIET